MKKELEGKVISLPIDSSYIRLCDDNGYVIEDESKLPLVYVKDKGVFRVIGWTAKMKSLVTIKNVLDGEELPYAPISELRRLYLEYNISQKLPIITETDYTFLYRSGNIIDFPEINKVKFYQMFYEVDNTEEARKQFDDGESVLQSSTKAIWYAKLVYSPDEQWDSIIFEAEQYKASVRPVTAHLEREKAFWNYIKSNYYPPTKRK